MHYVLNDLGPNRKGFGPDMQPIGWMVAPLQLVGKGKDLFPVNKYHTMVRRYPRTIQFNTALERHLRDRSTRAEPVEWPDGELNAINWMIALGVERNRSVEWLDWELNDQCQRWRECWMCPIWKLNFQLRRSERVGDRIRQFRSRAYRKRKVE
jgi:hypothetical protein